MRRILCALTIAVGLTAAAGAITYGIPDGNAHPNVGLFIAKIDNVYYAICSGTLVSERVFLTAGHCTDALRQLGGEAYVTFTPAPPYSVASFVPGTTYTHPDYGKSFPNTADLGVIVLNNQVTGVLPARVPSAGFLDELSTRRGLNSAYFTHVGYGTQSVRPRYISQVVRYQGISDLVNLVSAWTDGFNLQTTANPGKERSGVCFGDSGGPAFFQGTDVVVGVHSFVKNDNCKGTAFSYRVDLPISLDFLADFGVTPSF